MTSILVFEHGHTRRAEQVDPAWLAPDSAVRFWLDIVGPTQAEGQLLAGTLGLHPLSVEDALSRIQFPKVEDYEGYLYLVMHGIAFRELEHQFATRDVDFFLGPNFLVTIHDGESRSIRHVAEMCGRREALMAEGPAAMLHRIVDAMVDNYRPAIDALEGRITMLEERAFERSEDVVRPLLQLKRDLSSLRRVVIPQRDVVGRLARREFDAIPDEMAYRFRDVYDHLVRLSDEAVIFHDRVNTILEVHLTVVSNRLNEIMKVLTVMSTIFLPLTVLTGIWGMNIVLPNLPGGPAAQFWWLLAMIGGIVMAMLAYFKRRNWL